MSWVCELSLARRIDIIGGGIGGLTAAIAAAQQGVEACVLEQADELGEVGAGIQLGPNAMAVLSALGLGDAVRDIARVPEAVVLNDAQSGRRLTRFPLGESIEDRTGFPFINVHRADLIDVLAERARADCTVMLGHRIAAVGTEPGARIELGTGGVRQPDVVIAADGARSDVRRMLFSAPLPTFAGHIAWRMLVDLPDGWASQVTVWLGAGKHVVAYPVRDGLLNIVAIEKRGMEMPED